VLEQRGAKGVLAIDAAGKIPYRSGLFTIDMLGLSDRHIARMPDFGRFAVGHAKYDADYVLNRRPDLIVALIASPALDLMWGLSRDKYVAAGYRVKYLVNVSEVSRGTDVIEAEGLDPQAVRQLVLSGYQCAVLARGESLKASKPSMDGIS